MSRSVRRVPISLHVRAFFCISGLRTTFICVLSIEKVGIELCFFYFDGLRSLVSFEQMLLRSQRLLLASQR